MTSLENSKFPPAVERKLAENKIKQKFYKKFEPVKEIQNSKILMLLFFLAAYGAELQQKKVKDLFGLSDCNTSTYFLKLRKAGFITSVQSVKKPKNPGEIDKRAKIYHFDYFGKGIFMLLEEGLISNNIIDPSMLKEIEPSLKELFNNDEYKQMTSSVYFNSWFVFHVFYDGLLESGIGEIYNKGEYSDADRESIRERLDKLDLETAKTFLMTMLVEDILKTLFLTTPEIFEKRIKQLHEYPELCKSLKAVYEKSIPCESFSSYQEKFDNFVKEVKSSKK
jgi:hypothetical protein